MFNKNPLPIVIVAISLWTCQTTNTNYTKLEKDVQPLDRVLVIALTNSYDARSMWEKELTYRLNSKGFNVIPSINLDKEYKKLYTTDELRELISVHKLDGILAAKLKSIDREASYTQSDRYISDTYNDNIYMYNYLDPYRNVRAWDYKLDNTVTIEAILYSAETEKKLFDSETSMTNAESNEALAGEITESISVALKKSKLLKSKDK